MILDDLKKQAVKLIDNKNPFSALYELPTGEMFYLEPLFESYLNNFAMHYPEKVSAVVEEMLRVIKVNKNVIFTGMDEEFEDEPATKKEGFIIYTLFDITDKLNILIDNKSRGSDYGD